MVIFVSRVVDLYWLIVPAFYPAGLHLYWLDLALLLAIGGFWLAFFIQQWMAHPALPQHDPHLQTVHEEAHAHARHEEFAAS